jgi:hypothetical protein
MRSAYLLLACLCLFGLLSTPASAAPTSHQSETKASADASQPTARLAKDIVALAPNPNRFEPNAVGCPHSICVMASGGGSPPEFDPDAEPGEEQVHWHHECVSAPGMDTRCAGGDAFGSCSTTINCSGISY